MMKKQHLLTLLLLAILVALPKNSAIAQCNFSIVELVTDNFLPCGSMGSIQLAVSGGQLPYTYQWSNGTTNANINYLFGGSYSVTVTDASGCSLMKSYSIDNIPYIYNLNTNNLVITNATCGQSNGSITGIIAPSNFNWYDETNNTYLPIGSPNAGPANVLNVAAGQYTISSTCFYEQTFEVGNDGLPSTETINQSTCDPTQVGTTTNTYTNVAGCDSTVTVITTLAPDLLIDQFITHDLSPCGPLGNINLYVLGGQPPYTYQWSNGTTNANINNLFSGSYNVTVTDANGCSLVENYFVNNYPAYYLDTDDVVITNATCGQSNGSITGLIAPSNFNWSNGNTILPIGSPNAGPANVLNVAAGSYTIFSNCFLSQTFQIGNDGLPSTETINQSTCDPTQVGTTTNTYTNVAGCDSTVTITTTLVEIDAEITQNGNTLTANNTTADAYQWLDCNNGNAPITGATTASFTPIVSGNYALAVTQNACTNNSDCLTVTITSISPINNNSFTIQVNENASLLNIVGINYPKTIHIYATDGKLFAHKKLSGNNNEAISISHLPKGVYIAQVQNEQGDVFTQKFVK